MIWGVEGRHMWVPGTMAEIVGDDVANFLALDLTDPAAVGAYLVERDPFNPLFIPDPDNQIAWSDFSSEATGGDLTGKTLSDGRNTWEGAGDSNDFFTDNFYESAFRTATLDVSGVTGPREVLASGSGGTTNVAVEVRISFDALAAGGPYLTAGVIARYTDLNNTLACELQIGDAPSFLKLDWDVGGSLATPVAAPIPDAEVSTHVTYMVRMYVGKNGRVRGWLGPASLTPPTVETNDAALATGGALDDGKVGIMDHYTTATTPITRAFDDFRAYVPTYDPLKLPLPVILNMRTDDANADLFPHYHVNRITGLQGGGDSGDRRDDRVGDQGETPRRSFRRGKTITYEGQTRAKTRPSLRQAEEKLSAVFDDQTYEGLMVVTPHPDYVEVETGHALGARNLAPNPSVETNVVGYRSGGGAGAPSRVSGAGPLVKAGSHYGSYFTGASTVPALAFIGGTDSFGQPLPTPLTPGVYSFRWRISTSYPIQWQIAFVNSAGATVGSVIQLFISPTAGQDFELLNRVAPAGTAYVENNFFQGVATNPVNISFDALQIEAGATLGPYFDGDSPEAKWLGTPHASASEIILPYRYYRARAMTCEIDDAISFSPGRASLGHESPFVVAVRNSRRSGVSYRDQAGAEYR